MADRELVLVFLSFLCISGVVPKPAVCHLPCCLKVKVTRSLCTDIIHKQTYNKGHLSFIVSLCVCLCAGPSLFFISFLATFLKECSGLTNQMLQPYYRQVLCAASVSRLNGI